MAYEKQTLGYNSTDKYNIYKKGPVQEI